MPSYGSNRSPSLRKMDYNNNNNGRYSGGGGSGKKWNFGNIFGDPFALATIGIAIVSGQQEQSGGSGTSANTC